MAKATNRAEKKTLIGARFRRLNMNETKRRKLSKAERIQIYDKCNRRCAYCGCDLEYKDMQVDHVKPLRCGGADETAFVRCDS